MSPAVRLAHPPSPFPPPYGYLVVESPVFGSPILLPITHPDDFRLAARVFGDEALAAAVKGPDQELLVTWLPKRGEPLSVDMSHNLHFLFAPRGLLERYCAYEGGRHAKHPAPERIFPRFSYTGDAEVMVTSEPQL